MAARARNRADLAFALKVEDAYMRRRNGGDDLIDELAEPRRVGSCPVFCESHQPAAIGRQLGALAVRDVQATFGAISGVPQIDLVRVITNQRPAIASQADGADVPL